jgi:hypothetical protein
MKKLSQGYHFFVTELGSHICEDMNTTEDFAKKLLYLFFFYYRL